MYTNKKNNRCEFLIFPVSAVSVHMNPGHSAARRISSPGPGLVPGQGRGRGAGDRLVLENKEGITLSHLIFS